MKAGLILVIGLLALGTSGRTLAQVSVDHAARFNGTTDFIASEENLVSTNDFTMEMWVRPTATHEIDAESQQGYAGIKGQRFALYPGHGTHLYGQGHAVAGISVGTNGVSVYEHSGDYLPAVIVYAAPINGWTHVAVVYRDRTPSLYINGELVRVGPRSVMAYVHPSVGDNHRRGKFIGGIGGGEYGYYAGDIDDVRIWGRALNPTEVVRASAGIAGLGTPLVDFDMNRAGAGAGLKVANTADDISPALSGVQSSSIAVRIPRVPGVTYGTALTPEFVPRSEIRAERTPEADHAKVSTPLNPAARRPELPAAGNPALK